MDRYLVIVNPTSGRGNGERLIPTLQAILGSRGLAFEIVRTQGQRHAMELAEKAVADGYRYVVGVGGDGTANEVVNGLMKAKTPGNESDVAMGILPAGRGNDFAHSIGMPTEVEAACDVLAQGHLKRIDVGHVKGGLFPDGRYFGNSVGIGFDAVVGFEAAKLTRLSGFPSYLVAALRTVFLYFKAPTVEIRLDADTLTLPALMVSIMNGQRQGGAFFMAPDASNDDGLLDLCIARDVSKARVFTLIPRFFSGSQFSQPEIMFHQSERVSIAAVEGVLPAHTDGETLCVDGTSLEIRLLPRQLDVLSPAA